MPLKRTAELSKEYNISNYRIRAAISRGDLNGEKKNNYWYVDNDEFHKWASNITKTKSKAKAKAKAPTKAKAPNKCPYCGSEHIKSASLVLSQGTFSGTGSHSNIGITTNGGVFIGTGNSDYNFQTDAARNVKTVNEENLGEQIGGFFGAGIGLLLGIFIGISSESFLIGLVIFFTISSLGVWMGRQSTIGDVENQRIIRETRDFDNSFVCQKCGKQFNIFN